MLHIVLFKMFPNSRIILPFTGGGNILALFKFLIINRFQVAVKLNFQ
jgi:hypothetical protein